MPINESLCAGCPIEGEYTPVDAKGPEDAPFLIVTDVPSKSLARKAELMPEASMTYFAREMMRENFEKEDFRFAPLCFCPYDQDSYTNKQKSAIHKHCRQHLLAEIKETKPDVVLPLGAAAVTQCVGRGTQITKVRGIPAHLEEANATMFPLSSPWNAVVYAQNRPMYRADIASFGRFVDSNYDKKYSHEVKWGNYEVIDDLQFLIDENPEVISFDTENTGLRWYQQGVDVRTYDPAIHKDIATFQPKFQILTMQFCTTAGTAYMLVWDHPENPIAESKKPKLRNQLRKLLCDEGRIVVGQNTKYDNVALWKTEGIRFRIGGCTNMLAALIDENAMEKNLDALTKIHVPEMAGYADYFNATVKKDRMWQEPIEKLVGYGCGDADATLRVYEKLEQTVAEDDLLWAHYIRVSIPGLNALAAMETEGMYTDDREALPAFRALMEKEVEEQRVKLLGQLNRDMRRDIAQKYLAKSANRNKTAPDALSFTRGEFVKEILFTHPKGFKLKPVVFTKSTKKLPDHLKEPSTSSKDHLPYFHDTCPFTFELGNWIKDNRLLGTNIIGFEKKYIVGGKVRPTYSLAKTVTGRTSSDDPNGQNYPKRGDRAKAYREIFKAPPGYFLCELDLSQAELRIAACMANEPTMIRIYREGGDIHKATALIVLGVTKEQFEKLDKAEQKAARQKAKAVNFGFLYGMGWRKFIGYAKTQYGVEFTEREAQRIRANFFKLYRRLSTWHDHMRDFAQNRKYVRSFSGRIRHLPMIDSMEDYVQQEAGRQAINSPVQEFGSSLGVMALGRMNDEIDPRYLKVVGFIHDAIICYVKKEYLDWGLRTVKTYMQTNPLKEWFNRELQVPIVADCGFGHTLGSVIECEGFELNKPFNYDGLRDKEGKLLIEVPPQKIPPNRGRAMRSIYTLPTDVEVEEVTQVTTRRLLRTSKPVQPSGKSKRIVRGSR